MATKNTVLRSIPRSKIIINRLQTYSPGRFHIPKRKAGPCRGASVCREDEIETPKVTPESRRDYSEAAFLSIRTSAFTIIESSFVRRSAIGAETPTRLCPLCLRPPANSAFATGADESGEGLEESMRKPKTSVTSD